MKENYTCVYMGGQGEIVEKKSRFIATVEAVESEEEALAFIEKTKKTYWDARHNCSAFIIGKRGEMERCSDDGEPQGTAGKPMLEVLRGMKLCNVAVVVTRYFGGTLLGTGGLVRAYTQATKAGLENSTIIEKCYATKVLMYTDYNGIGKIQYILGQQNIKIIDSEYSDQVIITALVPEAQVESIMAEITEGTNGRCRMECSDKVYFAVVEKEIIIFEE